MATRRSRPGDRPAFSERCPRRRRHPLRRPLNWPRYLKERKLAEGTVAYYWYPHPRDIEAGFATHCEPLGQDYAEAIQRAAKLNAHLDAWRHGRSGVKDLDIPARYGSVIWLFERYRRSPAFERVS
jgi:hypothetical protein